MCAVGSAVLAEISAPGFLERVQAAGARLWNGLEALSRRPGFAAVRGRGLLLALDLGRTAGQDIVEAALAHGLPLNAHRPHEREATVKGTLVDVPGESVGLLHVK